MAAALYETIVVNQVTSIGTSKSAASSSSSSSRASSRRPPSAWATARAATKAGSPGLSATASFLMNGARSPMVPRCRVTMAKPGAENDGGVGFADVGADLKGLQGQPFGLLGVPVNLRPCGTVEGEYPVHRRLAKPLVLLTRLDSKEIARPRQCPRRGQRPLWSVGRPPRRAAPGHRGAGAWIRVASDQVSASNTSIGLKARLRTRTMMASSP